MEVMMMSYDKILSSTLIPCYSSPHNSTPSTPPSPSPPSPPPTTTDPVVVASPCAACKILRRRCSAEKCVLAPYFPPTDPLKFATAHKVFGASNIIKLLQELPEKQRADAVSSMVYEANARLRDPVYGTAGAICHLQKQLSQLQAELAKAQAELLNMKCQQTQLIAMLINSNSSTTPCHVNNPNPIIITNDLPKVSLHSSPGDDGVDQDYSELDSPMSDEFLNFYPDTTNCSLITWDLP